MVTLRNIPRFNSARSQWLVRLVAATTATLGIIAILQPLSERLHGRVGTLFSPFDFDAVNRTAAIFIGFVLIYFSTKLLQRKIVAWWTALVASVAVFVVNIRVTHSLWALVMPALVVAVLMVTKTQFRVKSEAESVVSGIKLLGLSIAIALLYGVIGFWFLEKRDFGQTFSIYEAASHTLKEYSLLGGGDLVPHTRQARWFLQSLNALGAVSVGFGIYSLFRPLAYRFAILPGERDEVERILRLHGDSPEDFFKLWPPDKTYFFSPGRSAFVAYRVAAGVAVVLNDPVGPESEIGLLLENFRDFCLANGWVASFLDVPEAALPRFSQFAMRSLKIGEDAVVNLDHFAASVVQNKHFRNVTNRFSKAGYRFEFLVPPHSRATLTELSQISNEWLRLPGREERGFALGYFNRRYLQTAPLYVVRGENGKILAFANGIPTYHSPVATIDLMRHRADAPSNTMDYLFAELMLYLHQQGVKQFSLGLAPLSGMGSGEETNPEERLLGYIYRSGGRLFSFAGLRQFKNKFEPDWQEKYLVYNGGPQTLAQIALALSRVIKQHD